MDGRQVDNIEARRHSVENAEKIYRATLMNKLDDLEYANKEMVANNREMTERLEALATQNDGLSAKLNKLLAGANAGRGAVRKSVSAPGPRQKTWSGQPPRPGGPRRLASSAY